MAGVKYDAHYNVTSVDPPELIRFIKREYPEVDFEIPRDENGKAITMWNLIPKKKMPPTMLMRYCCKTLKERGGIGRIAVTGVRWAESPRRKASHGVISFHGKPKHTQKEAISFGAKYALNKRGSVILNDDNDEERRLVENCFRTNKTMLNPIIDWEESDVWEFLNHVAKVPRCELYDKGYTRIGCIGCPMNQNRVAMFEEYPKYKEHYISAFERMLKERDKAGLTRDWKTGQEVYDWWVSDSKKRGKRDEEKESA